MMASKTAATTTTNLKTSTNDEDGTEVTTATAFTPEQLQQLLIQLLPYNQMKNEEKDQHLQPEDDDEADGRLIIADENEDGMEEMTEKTNADQNERENASSMDAHLRQISNGQKHLMADEQFLAAGPSNAIAENGNDDATNNDGAAESLDNLPNGQTFPELLSKTAAKRKLHQTQTRKRPGKGGGGEKGNIGHQNSSNNQQKTLQNKKKKSTTNFAQKGQINLNQSSPSSQQIASLPFSPNFGGQQLTELFSAGIQNLLTLGGQSTIDQTNNSNSNNNPLANISVEELGRMVMEQMCKEIGDQAQQIMAQLAEIQPDATQEELMNAVALTMAGQFGLIADPNQTQNGQMGGNIAANQMELCNQNQQQFWQSIQLGLAQAMMAASMNGGMTGEKDDSGIVADQNGMEEDVEQIDAVIQRQEEAFGQQQLQALAECFAMAMANGNNLNDGAVDHGELFNAMLHQKQQNGENNAKNPGHKRMASKTTPTSNGHTHNQNPSTFNPSLPQASSFIPKNEDNEQNIGDLQKRHQSSIVNQPTEELTKLFNNQFVCGHQNDQYQSQLHICRPNSAQSSSTTISSSAASSAFSPSLANQQWDTAMGAAAMAEMCQQFFQQSTNIGEIEQNQQQQMLAIQMLSQMLISSQQQQPTNDQTAAFAAMLLNGCAQQQQFGGTVDPTAELLLQQQTFNVPNSIPTSILATMVDQSQQSKITHKPAIVPNPMFSHNQSIKSESKDEMDNDQQSHLLHLTNENRNGTGSHHFGIENKGSNPTNALMFLKRETTATDSIGDDHLNGNNRRKKPREGRARIGSQGASTLSTTTNVPLSTSTLVPGIAGTLTAKNEKSLGALLLQNPEGAERVEELKELEEFANSFKKLRIKHGFTQGDVGVALGKRYGTDFSQTTISRFEALNLSFKNMCKLRPLLQDWLTETERLLGAGATVQDVMEGIALQRVAVQQAKQKEASSEQPKMESTNAQQQQNFPELMATSHQFIDQQQILNGIMAATNGHGGNDQKVEAASGIGGGPMIPPFKKRRKRTNLDSNQKMLLDAHFRMDPRPDNSRMNEIARILDLDQDVVRVWFCNRRQKLRKV